MAIALVSARAAEGLDEDMPPLVEALRSIGAEVEVANWDDAQVDWSRFDLALLRSTWDASIHRPEFLAWSERVAQLTTLLNPPPVIRWNTDKHYLADLAQAGVPTVPGRFIEPGENVNESVAACLSTFGTPELVVKPAVGSGSRDAQRHPREDLEAIRAHVRRLLDSDLSTLVQPYLERVDEHGETALVYFEGRFSHAFHKGAMLKSGESPTDQLFAAETITSRTPTLEELAVGEQALRAIPFGQLLYARVDLIHDSNGQPLVLELEVTEPSVYVLHAAGSAERFAQAIAARASRKA